MRTRLMAGLRVALGAVVAGVVVVRLGTGPFLTGLRAVDVSSVAAACAIAVVTTVCCAWRWRLVAGALGLPIRIGPAVRAYYRSQFLNGALPGGVLGDLHRGARHGRVAGDLGRGVRAVMWERTAGQLVQAAAVVVALAVLPSPVRTAARVVLAAAVGGALVLAVVAPVVTSMTTPAGATRRARAWRTIGAEVRAGVSARAVLPGVVVTSVAAFAGHLATFVIAARAVGTAVPLMQLLPLGMVVLLAAAVPTSIGGWGPREGGAAWAFAAAGLDGSQGVAAAALYGVLVTVASLPGAIVALSGAPAPVDERPSLVHVGGTSHG